MKTHKITSKLIIILISFIFLYMEGCTLLKRKTVTPQKTVEKKTESNLRLKRRKLISTKKNLYEGSLWRNESSFGNLWRDHRARFRHDLLTISEVNQIISVPEAQEETAEALPKTDLEKASLVLEALNLKDEIEQEQNDILRSIDTISAEVIKVLPNGNMIVRGRRVDNRQRNQIRYVTTVVGILRPADIDDSNIVSAAKLVYPEVKIKRQIQGTLLKQRIQKLAPLLGKQQANFLERLSDFSKTSKNTTTVK